MSDIHALSGAYAVDAVDDVERARFERHLADCDACRQEVAELREAAALLADEVATPAPDSLRASVLSGIARVRPLPPETLERAETAETSKSPESSETPTPAVRRRWLPALVAAAVLAVVGVGVGVTQPWREDSAQTQLSAADRVLQAPDARSVSLSFDDGSTATLTRSMSEGRAVIRTEDMAAPPAGKVFELWLQNDAGDMVPAGVMPVQPDLTLLLEGDAATATAAGITVEPEGGSERPTTDPIALFDFAEAT